MSSFELENIAPSSGTRVESDLSVEAIGPNPGTRVELTRAIEKDEIHGIPSPSALIPVEEEPRMVQKKPLTKHFHPPSQDLSKHDSLNPTAPSIERPVTPMPVSIRHSHSPTNPVRRRQYSLVSPSRYTGRTDSVTPVRRHTFEPGNMMPYNYPYHSARGRALTYAHPASGVGGYRSHSYNQALGHGIALMPYPQSPAGTYGSNNMTGSSPTNTTPSHYAQASSVPAPVGARITEPQEYPDNFFDFDVSDDEAQTFVQKVRAWVKKQRARVALPKCFRRRRGNE